MTPDTVLVRSDKAQFTRLDDELLAIDADTGFCYSLNETAGAMWSALERPMAIDAVCRQLANEYDVDRAACLAEVTALAVELERAGLLTVAPAPTMA